MNENNCLALTLNCKASHHDIVNSIGILYILTCLINGKRYIGISLRSFLSRYKTTQSDWERSASNKHLLRAFRKHGISNFHIQILHKNKSIFELDLLEKFYIKFYNTINHEFGYNKTIGGYINSFGYNTSLYIKEVNLIHNNFYCYDKVIYKGMHNKINIVCPVHGSFYQTADYHLRGSGCSKCAKVYIPTTTEFIEKTKHLFKNTYSYDKTNYLNSNSKLTITCSLHGDFLVTPANFLRGRGCPKCKGQKISAKLRDTKDEFITKARSVHSNCYIYDLVNYIDQLTNITIVCPTHGAFLQTPSSHLSGHGCVKCAGRLISTREDFITRSITIFDNSYDYSQVKYINSITPVLIRCQFHGSFHVIPNKHIHRKQGCPQCGKNKRLKILTKYTNIIIKNKNSVLNFENINLIIDFFKVTRSSVRDFLFKR